MPDELSQEDIDALLAGASDMGSGGSSAAAGISSLLSSASPMNLPDFGGGGGGGGSQPEPASIDMLFDVELDVRIELGRTYMSVEDVLRLQEGSVVQLDKDAGAPVDILINGKLVAEGEVLVLNDYFCVRVTNILSNRDRSIIKR